MSARRIKHENGRHWVYRGTNDYTVYTDNGTHGVADSSYAKTPDGLSIAIARCDYLAKRDKEKA